MAAAISVGPTGTIDSGWSMWMKARNSSDRPSSKRRRNQPWPSAITSGVVTSGGGSAECDSGTGADFAFGLTAAAADLKTARSVLLAAFNPDD